MRRMGKEGHLEFRLNIIKMELVIPEMTLKAILITTIGIIMLRVFFFLLYDIKTKFFSTSLLAKVNWFVCFVIYLVFLLVIPNYLIQS